MLPKWSLVVILKSFHLLNLWCLPGQTLWMEVEQSTYWNVFLEISKLGNSKIFILLKEHLSGITRPSHCASVWQECVGFCDLKNFFSLTLCLYSYPCRWWFGISFKLHQLWAAFIELEFFTGKCGMQKAEVTSAVHGSEFAAVFKASTELLFKV